MALILDSQLTDYTALHPCVQCFDGSELDMLLIVLLATKAGYTLPDDLSTLVSTTVCLKCLSDTQLKENLAAFLWEQQAPTATSDELMAQAKCLKCADPKTIKALLGYLTVLGLTPT